MRVIAGTLGGRTLHAPRGRGTRPTSDRVREALFSILGEITGARVLDLYAGTGALGIEALSRGARSATLVDSGRPALQAIRRNLKELGITAEVAAEDALHFCVRAFRDGRQYDLIFLDPPYRHGDTLADELTAALAPLLSPAGRAVTESDRRTPLDLDLPLLDERRYGDTLIRIHGTN